MNAETKNIAIESKQVEKKTFFFVINFKNMDKTAQAPDILSIYEAIWLLHKIMNSKQQNHTTLPINQNIPNFFLPNSLQQQPFLIQRTVLITRKMGNT